MAEKGDFHAHFIKSVINPIGGAVGLVILSGLTFLFYKIFPLAWHFITSWIAYLCSAIYNWVITPVWVRRWHYWLLFSFAAYSILRWIAKQVAKRKAPPGETPIDISDYTKDTFFGAVWCWEYVPHVSHLTPRCRQCDRVMIHTDDRITYCSALYCDACRLKLPFSFSFEELLQKVQIEIDLKYRNGSFKDVVRVERARREMQPDVL